MQKLIFNERDPLKSKNNAPKKSKSPSILYRKSLKKNYRKNSVNKNLARVQLKFYEGISSEINSWDIIVKKPLPGVVFEPAFRLH